MVESFECELLGERSAVKFTPCQAAVEFSSFRSRARGEAGCCITVFRVRAEHGIK